MRTVKQITKGFNIKSKIKRVMKEKMKKQKCTRSKIDSLLAKQTHS
jgi:hypothetical protein